MKVALDDDVKKRAEQHRGELRARKSPTLRVVAKEEIMVGVAETKTSTPPQQQSSLGPGNQQHQWTKTNTPIKLSSTQQRRLDEERFQSEKRFLRQKDRDETRHKTRLKLQPSDLKK